MKSDPILADSLSKATFAGGCFWCMEPPFEKLEGVIGIKSGYTGGSKANPTYEEVCSGTTGHTEAVEVLFDTKKVSYETLLYTFWRNIDPTVKNRQFFDVGTQYRTAIFYHSPEQQQLAEASKEALKQKFPEIYTEILPAGPFYPAEEHHQKFYRKNPERYNAYRIGCGRDASLDALWGDER